jgi:hypothetical protein
VRNLETAMARLEACNLTRTYAALISGAQHRSNQRPDTLMQDARPQADRSPKASALGEELLMQLQLNVHRLVVVYRVADSMH